jgi:ubiquinone/menaquinone biosynthesis C-methylase UbiE
MSETAAPTPERIMQFAWGYAPTLILEAALHHRVFDALDEKSQSVSELAAKTATDERALRSILDALVGFEFLSKDQNGEYSNTPESSAFLVTTKPGFQGGIFQHTSTQLLPKWLQLNEIVKTGQPATAVNQEGDGSEFFEQFVEAIFPMSYMAAQTLGKSLHLESASTPVKVLDIAAGSGVWGVALAQQSPQVAVTAVDWPGVLPVTRRVAARFGLSDQFTFVEGDLLQADYGEGFQIATLGHIIHSEGETRSKQLLQKVFAALAPGGTIAIAEMVPNHERTGPPFALIFAVNMIVNTEAGNTYSFEEMHDWLREAGFQNVRQLEAPAPSPLILADKP